MDEKSTHEYWLDRIAEEGPDAIRSRLRHMRRQKLEAATLALDIHDRRTAEANEAAAQERAASVMKRGRPIERWILVVAVLSVLVAIVGLVLGVI